MCDFHSFYWTSQLHNLKTKISIFQQSQDNYLKSNDLFVSFEIVRKRFWILCWLSFLPDLVLIELLHLFSIFFNAQKINKRCSNRSDEHEGCLQHFVSRHDNHDNHHRIQHPGHQIELDGHKIPLPSSLSSLSRQSRGIPILFQYELISHSVENWDSQASTKEGNEDEKDSKWMQRWHVKIIAAFWWILSKVQCVVVKFLLPASAN